MSQKPSSGGRCTLRRIASFLAESSAANFARAATSPRPSARANAVISKAALLPIRYIPPSPSARHLPHARRLAKIDYGGAVGFVRTLAVLLREIALVRNFSWSLWYQLRLRPNQHHTARIRTLGGVLSPRPGVRPE